MVSSEALVQKLGKKEKEIERELADVTFEELQKALSDGSHAARIKHGKTNENGKRLNKNRPSEMSSKKAVGVFREVIQAPKKTAARDPRFDSLSGNLDPEGFRKRYDFLYEVQLPTEKENLKKLLKKSKDPNTIEELKNQLSWIDKQIKSAPHRNAESEIRSEHYKKEKEAAKHGKRPYFLKKSEIRNLMLTKKYEELKGQGKVDKVIEKKRRKNAAKDHRLMPYRKPMETAQG